MVTLLLNRSRKSSGNRFFLISAFIMAAVVVAGFGIQLVMGRSTFTAPPLVHAHAVLFMGWVSLYVIQNCLIATGNTRFHRRLGWLGAAWMFAMVPVGIATTIAMVRRGAVPFFFEPAYFLMMNSISILTFVALGIAAIALRRRTEWHRRLHFCAMAFVIGPAFGRLLPLPLMIPWAGWGVFAAVMLFPMSGMRADWRRTRHIHPAWWIGVTAMTFAQILMGAIAYSPVGVAIYNSVTTGYPGEQVDPLAYPPLPPEFAPGLP